MPKGKETLGIRELELSLTWGWRKKGGETLAKAGLNLACAMVWMFVPPQNSCFTSLMPKVMLLGGEDFGRWLGDEGRALMNGVSAIIKEAPESAVIPSTTWGHREKLVVCNPEQGSLQNLTILAPWSWACSPPELWEIDFCCLWDAWSVVFCYNSLNRLRYPPALETGHLV